MGDAAQAKVEGVRKFLISVDGVRTFMPLQQAGSTFSSLWQKIEIVGLVQEADGTVRDITLEERNKIVHIADQCDADK